VKQWSEDCVLARTYARTNLISSMLTLRHISRLHSKLTYSIHGVRTWCLQPDFEWFGGENYRVKFMAL